MSLTDSLTTALRRIPIPSPLHDHRTAILASAAVLGTSLIFPAAYRDYQLFKSYGQGGIPNNLAGWLIVRLLMQPLGREMLSTDEYERRVAATAGQGPGSEGYLLVSETQLASRSAAARPFVGPHVVPQRQMTQLPEQAIMEKLRGSFLAFGRRNEHLVKLSQSLAERHSDALFLADHLRPTEITQRTRGEISHVHTGKDHSLHVILAPADCKKVIDAGWGQRHAFSGTAAMSILSLGLLPGIPWEYLLIYAPRTEAEIETVMQIVAASVKFATGREDVR
ncbi:hypothetical protein NUU61_010046 [Penicillium alfredii]|uniref:Luciferase domain-containing protein n=1 Tax=Penicillium alfredii TaxID=1506179 RepID=A0A9W9JUM4_9EURO|nr:uncharacterized protein NUU61_010046 [Penicillium alfredii]KAJ5081782.1 hypothetical protein NUU61_010046 [Penicillium alfredii]